MERDMTSLYKIIIYYLLSDSVSSGQSVSVNLTSITTVPFKGFLIQAQDSKNNVIGNFSTSEIAKCLDCVLGCNSITHRNDEMKTEVFSTWNSPSSYEGTVYFRYTVVTEYKKYWVAVNGPNITVIL